MSRDLLKCKTCGKEYLACRTFNPGVFRWQDVACSRECAEKYIVRVEAARAKNDILQAIEQVDRKPVEPVVEPEPVHEDQDASEFMDEFDDELYDEFDDEDEEFEN